MCDVVTITSIIWPSQDLILKAQSNNEAGSSGNGHIGGSGLAQNIFPWDNRQKKKLMWLSHIRYCQARETVEYPHKAQFLFLLKTYRIFSLIPKQKANIQN